MSHRTSSISDAAIKAQLVLRRQSDNDSVAEADMQCLCRDIVSLRRRQLAAERRRTLAGVE